VPLDRDKHPGFALFDFGAPTALERHLAVARLTSVERLGWKAAAPREPKFYRQMNKVGLNRLTASNATCLHSDPVTPILAIASFLMSLPAAPP
jgi:hypothetical protein